MTDQEFVVLAHDLAARLQHSDGKLQPQELREVSQCLAFMADRIEGGDTEMAELVMDKYFSLFTQLEIMAELDGF